MEKARIIGEIQRTAKANGNVPLGWRRFESETGIRYYDWYGQFWSKWGDAVREAGFEPNSMTEAYEDRFLLEQLVSLTRKLGRVPTQGDIVLAANNDPSFPSEKVFRRLGAKAQRVLRVVEFCEADPAYTDVAALWRQGIATAQPQEIEETETSAPAAGYVYLVKHGSRREYKIGKTFNPLRREGEIALQLPEKLEPIHYIKTDDPSGIENYWHTRFAEKRKEGEWFALTAEDVRAFKRWKRIH